MLGAKLGVSDYLTRVCQDIQNMDRAQIEAVSDADRGRLRRGPLRLHHRQWRLRGQCLAFLRGPGQVHPPRFRVAEAAQGPEPDRQRRGDHGVGQRRGLRPDLRRAVEEPGLAGRPAAGDLGLGQQPQHPQGRELGQRARARDRRASPGSRAASSRRWRTTTSIRRSTTWGSPSRCTWWSSTGSSTTCTGDSPPRTALPRRRSELNAMAEPWLLGIEIGGTKLQLGIGRGRGEIVALERLPVDPARRASGIREQIAAAFPALLAEARLDRGADRRPRASASAARWTRTGAASSDPTRSTAGRISRSPTGCARTWESRRSSSTTMPMPRAWRSPASAPARITHPCFT